MNVTNTLMDRKDCLTCKYAKTYEFTSEGRTLNIECVFLSNITLPMAFTEECPSVEYYSYDYDNADYPTVHVTFCEYLHEREVINCPAYVNGVNDLKIFRAPIEE